MPQATTTTSTALESLVGTVTLRTAEPGDTHAIARIIHDAFAGIHDRHGFPRDFPTIESATQLADAFVNHPTIWGVVATNGEQVVGSNFLDERDPVRGIGPISVDVVAQAHGIGRRLMQTVIDRGADGAGVRLLQDAFNAQSMGLYTDLGFVTREPIALLTGRIQAPTHARLEVRPMTAEDLDACADLGVKVHGFPRRNELRDALAHPALAPIVGTRRDRIVAYASGVSFFPGSFGAAESEAELFALIAGSLQATETPASFLLPTRQTELFRALLAAGLRVVKPMTYMTLGTYHEPRGAWFPSVLY